VPRPSHRRVRRTRSRPSPKPDLVLEAAPAEAPVSLDKLEPSHAKPRDVYEPNDADNAAFEEVVTTVLDATGVPYELRTEHGDYQRAFLELPPRQAGALIGRKGASIDALELLLSRMASQRVGHNVPVQVDVNEYRERYEEELREQARGMAEAVRSSGEIRHMKPMNSRERRVVHLAVQALGGLTTYTVGEGSQRHVVIGKAPEQAG